MTSCNQALVTITKQTLASQLNDINYKIQKNNAWLKMTKAIQARDLKYPNQDIDAKYADGWYVDPRTPNIIEVFGAPYDCNQNTWSAGYCTSISDDRQTKCCACGQKFSCNNFVGCNWNGCVNNRLNRNRHEAKILAEKADLQIINNNIAALKNIYDSVIVPPIQPNINIGCCQSMIYSNISANAVNFDSNTQTCTVNGAIQNAFKSRR